MIIRRIEGTTNVLGPPPNWDLEIGKCVSLPVRISFADGYVISESAWEPDPLEFKALNAGGSIILRVYGGQPPVALYVTETLSEDGI